MSSALAFYDHICWGTNAAVHDILGRATSIAAERYGVGDPVSQLLARELAEYWGGKVVNLSEADPPVDQLFELLTAAREQACASDEFTAMGRSWLTGAMATFCKEVEMAIKPPRRTVSK